MMEHNERQKERLNEQRDRLRGIVENDDTTVAPNLNKNDINFLATTQVKLSQKEILRMYVGNWQDLNLKQRRRVMAFVQAQRSKHAKEIFLKELSALGRKMNQEKDAILSESRIKGKKDPLKLKLENITA